MATKRSTAKAYRAPALDMATAEKLSKKELLEALQRMADQELLDTAGANTILQERTSTHQQALQASQVELSAEEMIDKYLAEFEPRFNELKARLRHNVTFEEVKRALKGSPEVVRKLKTLDDAGFAMNIFKSKQPDYLQFRTAQLDVLKIDGKYRTIMYDKQAQINCQKYQVNVNAVDMAKGFGCELVDPELYNQLRVESGWLWLETDAATRKSGCAFFGNRNGPILSDAYLHDVYGSFAAALRVKKV